MKRNVSDLMNHVLSADVEIEMNTPLSSERIRELTMSKITENKALHKRRRIFRVMMVAAIIAALSVSVFAAGNGLDWFREFFTKNRGETLSDGQIEYIDENTVILSQTQDAGDYTVILDSYIGDVSKVYLRLQIQAPDGTAIPKNGYDFDRIDARYSDGETVMDTGRSGRRCGDCNLRAGFGLYPG